MGLFSRVILGATASLAIAGAVVAQDRGMDSRDRGTMSRGDSHHEWDDWYVGGAAGYIFAEGDATFQPGQTYELRVGKDLDRKWSVEGGVGFLPFVEARDFDDGRFEGEDDTYAVNFRADALYHFDEAGKRGWDPYASIGAGYMIRGEVDRHGSGDPYPALGFGAFYNMDNDWYVKPEYHITSVNEDSSIDHHAMLSVGYRFGGGGAGAAASDGREGRNANEASTNLFGEDGRRLEPINFAFDSSDLSANACATLKRNADFLKTKNYSSVTIEGHCDERGTNEYNFALGQRRANSAHEYLGTLGVDKSKASTVSYGEERPVDPAHNEAAWSRNRRDEFVVR